MLQALDARAQVMPAFKHALFEPGVSIPGTVGGLGAISDWLVITLKL